MWYQSVVMASSALMTTVGVFDIKARSQVCCRGLSGGLSHSGSCCFDMPVKRAEQRCGDAGGFCLSVRESGHQTLSICFMTYPAEVGV